MSEMDALVGKKIISVSINPDKTTLKFNLEAGPFNLPFIAFDAEGDCCSNSWFNNITGIANLLGEEVVEVESKAEPSESKPNTTDHGEEEMSYYGVTLKTKKGFCDIEFRNSSNGYYGGYLTLNEGPTDDFKPVTEDF